MRLVIAGLLTLLVSGCSSGGAAAPSTSAAPTTSSASVAGDCDLARTAISDYSTAVGDLAVSVKTNDSMSAVAAADGMLYALDQLMPAVKAVGDPGAAFAAQAWAVASLVKTSAANGSPVEGNLPRITEAFKAEDYRAGAAAIESYVAGGCA